MKKLIVTGNLGKDPDKKIDGTGNMFVTFSIAVAVGTKDNPKTDWVDVSCNGKLAELAGNYLAKGSKVLITGFPTVHSYINKDNNAIGVLKVYADNIEFLSAKSDNVQHNDVNIVSQMNKANIEQLTF